MTCGRCAAAREHLPKVMRVPLERLEQGAAALAATLRRTAPAFGRDRLLRQAAKAHRRAQKRQERT